MTYGITNAGGGKSANLGLGSATSNGTYTAVSDGYDGYSEFSVAVPPPSVTATNNSSYAREAGEKVWLYENSGSYSIVDNLGLTTNAFTGKCKEAIAIGASGEVEAITSGNIVTRWTRDITSTGGFSLDDTTKIATATGSASLYKNITNGIDNLPVATSSFEVRTKTKINLSSLPSSGVNYNGMRCFIMSGYSNGKLGLGFQSFSSGQVPGISVTLGGSSKVLVNSTDVVFNQWYWLKVIGDSNGITASVSTDGVNYYNPQTISNASTLTGLENTTKFSFDAPSLLTSTGGSLSFDLDEETTFVKIDGNIVWRPYKPVTE